VAHPVVDRCAANPIVMPDALASNQSDGPSARRMAAGRGSLRGRHRRNLCQDRHRSGNESRIFMGSPYHLETPDGGPAREGQQPRPGCTTRNTDTRHLHLGAIKWLHPRIWEPRHRRTISVHALSRSVTRCHTKTPRPPMLQQRPADWLLRLQRSEFPICH
jgi:hypothetical protein